MKALQLCLSCAAVVAGLAHAGNYDAVRIVAPEEGATVHENSGNVAVVVSVSPAVDAAAGDRIIILLDGGAVAERADARFELNGVDRGTHRLQAQVTAADGSVLATSPPVSFQMWRASRQFPGRKQ